MPPLRNAGLVRAALRDLVGPVGLACRVRLAMEKVVIELADVSRRIVNRICRRVDSIVVVDVQRRRRRRAERCIARV